MQISSSHSPPPPLPLRLGEGGKIGKGPVGMGLRLQDTLRIGAFKVEACAAKVTTDGAQGGKDEAWGGRAFVRYDWLPVRGREGGAEVKNEHALKLPPPVDLPLGVMPLHPPSLPLLSPLDPPPPCVTPLHFPSLSPAGRRHAV